MKNTIQLIQRSFQTAIIFAIILFSSCEKPESDVGIGLQEGLLITQADTTVQLETYISRVDSIQSDALSINLCGNLIDPKIGRTETSISFGIKPVLNDVEFGDISNIEIDSMVLSLSYSGYIYGKNTDQTFELKEILSEFEADSAYYSDDQFNLSSENLLMEPNRAYAIDINENLIIGDQSLSPQLRIHLKNDLGEYFLNNIGENDDQWNDQASFEEFFHGLNLTSKTIDGAVVGYDVKNFESRLTMHYRNTLEEDTLEYLFFTNEVSPTLTHFANLYSNELFALNTSAEIEQNDVLYVKAGASLETRIVIPDFLDGYMDGESVNKAELVIPVDVSDEFRFSVPDVILLANKDDEGVIDFLPDETAFSNFDGLNNEYRINISQYIQKVLSGELDNKDLYLVPLSSGITVTRAILHGPSFNPSDISQNMRFEITYTK